MKKLRCESCGGELRIEENGDYASCDYCRTKYKLNEDHTVVIKLDDSVKEVGKNIKVAAVPFMVMGTIFIVFFIFVFGVILYEQHEDTKTFNSNVAKSHEEFNSNVAKMNEQINSNIEDSKSNLNSNAEEFKKNRDITSFNFKYNIYQGTQTKLFIESLLDTVFASNQANERKIVVVFNEKTISNNDEILNIKKSLKDNKDYVIKYEYDSEGYINKVIIK